jgi:hypothetical protein
MSFLDDVGLPILYALPIVHRILQEEGLRTRLVLFASGKLISPASLSGGEIFQKGTHVLPVDQIADRYGNDLESFYSRGLELGGKQLDYGDASLRLYPFPRVPVTMILWMEDEEFPARVDMFFDVTCEQHLPMDVIWSTAMTSVLIML